MKLSRLFWIPKEKRLPVVWRLIIQIIFMFLLALPIEHFTIFLNDQLHSNPLSGR